MDFYQVCSNVYLNISTGNKDHPSLLLSPYLPPASLLLSGICLRSTFILTMGSTLSLNYTDNQQNYPGNYSTCSVSYGNVLNEAELFFEQFLSIAFLSTRNSNVHVVFFLSFLIGIVGMVGNGSVIWLLGFHVKRNNFTIYVLNLAIADFIMLVSVTALSVIICVDLSKEYDIITKVLFLGQFISFTYYVGLYLLTAISVERCLSILFPIWVHCHRPKHLSIIVSVLFWIVSALITVTEFLLQYFCLLDFWLTFSRIFSGINLFIFTPVMVVSTLILFIKMSFRHQSGKLHKTLLIVLLFFIITAVPFSIFFFFSIIDYNFHSIALPIYHLLVVLNSSINPIIYFFVGNQCTCKSIKVVFQNVFKDETELTEVG
ncbi:mas-related G-protein coupled receptor member H-like isoform X1 [Anolis carolinensis]|uniref:mas-related G-protein coupled receptor member H-like isoform X1 n=1 Tax=Anolis carolinensis TaxID=28377 RepID=UPI002F2B869D